MEELTRNIIATLKEAGIARRDYRIRTRNGGSTAVDIYVKPHTTKVACFLRVPCGTRPL